MRGAMHFHRQAIGDYTLTTMSGDEPGYDVGGRTLLVSIAGPGLPGIRITATGVEPLTDEDGGTPNVIVFGHGKGNRPILR